MSSTHTPLSYPIPAQGKKQLPAWNNRTVRITRSITQDLPLASTPLQRTFYVVQGSHWNCLSDRDDLGIAFYATGLVTEPRLYELLCSRNFIYMYTANVNVDNQGQDWALNFLLAMTLQWDCIPVSDQCDGHWFRMYLSLSACAWDVGGWVWSDPCPPSPLPRCVWSAEYVRSSCLHTCIRSVFNVWLVMCRQSVSGFRVIR